MKEEKENNLQIHEVVVRIFIKSINQNNLKIISSKPDILLWWKDLLESRKIKQHLALKLLKNFRTPKTELPNYLQNIIKLCQLTQLVFLLRSLLFLQPRWSKIENHKLQLKQIISYRENLWMFLPMMFFICLQTNRFGRIRKKYQILSQTSPKYKLKNKR
jgi:hypothetical protein